MRALIAIEIALLALAGGCAPGSSSDASESSNESGSASTSEGSASTSAGSSGVDESSSGGAGAGGTVTLAFSVSNGVRMGPTLVDPLMGSVYGDIYLTSEVTLIGPAEGAVAVASVELDGVDLTTADVSAATWTSEALPPESYTFLGMFDVDGNFEATDHNPDPGDPVTLTSQSFDVVAGQDTAFTVTFELVYG